ncbi:phosphonate metabolism protein/1,5-bisphosphokinase (PRPP-forming) PhnN [Paragemmobacter straminiformis]|uniref:Ribose 1,5-bisphosphate phosphokinase PhnN n=1 Tax=Paragemmobacter straminiformis TaxID=2045119 RepID=A0A842IAH4_9RHOB|nr:phosphonate metabolism protein/1,5-bisphosphokinase (PRPP-forming) PhnN [Gemmobacter straminiformis]MBC2836860.1 phosphonate metabolism protein/1,5-bisphosphokinase (PRPP-forming) PhnN [Gemmobacter straminiformis]
MKGRLFAVVGPSGAGKDTLIDAVRAARPDLVIARRVITRPASAGGEDFEGVSLLQFTARKQAGGFALDWKAHGLCYGIPAETLARRDAGHDVLFNGSRAALDSAARLFPDLSVIRVTAPSAVLTERLLARGRETRDEIAARISRASYDIPQGLSVTDVVNDGPLEQGIARFLAALQPASA